MTADSFPSPSAPAESDLRPPPVPTGFVTRRSLLETLTRIDADVITLVAPTGYGKTTILAQWAAVETAPLAWLSLRADSSPANSLLSHLAASMKRAGIITAEDSASFQVASNLTSAAEGVRLLARLLESSDSDKIVIVIDDTHLLRSRAAIELVSDLTEKLEGLARLVYASHSKPKIRLSTIRSRGRLLEITDEHLAFSTAEVEHLAAGLGLDQRIAAEIVETTGGWPAATFLTALAAREGRQDPARSRLVGQRHLREFVMTEVVPTMSGRQRRFMTLMSLLERMSGPLCDFVAGADDSQRLLVTLERDTRLIHQLDHDGTWFAMNRVVRDALSAGLEHHEPETAQTVRSSAAEWHEANGMLVEAAGYSLEANDAEAFARLMERVIKHHYVSGNVEEVLEWMAWLDESVSLEDYPGPAAIGALVHIQEGNIWHTERWLEAASKRPADRETKAVIGLVRAAATRSGVEQMIRDIDEALDVAGLHSRWIPAILVVKGLAHLMSGDADSAESAFVEASRIGVENQSLSSAILAMGETALLAIRRHQWDLAERLSGQAVAILDENGLDGYLTSGPPLIAAARCARHRNEIAKAERLLARAATVRPRLGPAFPGAGVQILLEMAKAHLELSDVAGARSLIRESEEIILQRPDLGVLPAELTRLKESLKGLGPGNVRLPTLTKAELRLLPLLATHLSFPEIGEQLFVSRHTIKSQATSIYRKLGSSTRSEAIAKAYEVGLLSK